jgi:hypothetical protein
MPSLPSPHITHLLDAPIAPIAPLVLLEELRRQAHQENLMVLEVSPLVLPSPIPTLSYQLSLVTSRQTAFSISCIFFHCFFSSLDSCFFSQDSYTFVPLLPARFLPFSVSQERIPLFSSQSSVSCSIQSRASFSFVLAISCLCSVSCPISFRLGSFLFACSLACFFASVMDWTGTRLSLS